MNYSLRLVTVREKSGFSLALRNASTGIPKIIDFSRRPRISLKRDALISSRSETSKKEAFYVLRSETYGNEDISSQWESRRNMKRFASGSEEYASLRLFSNTYDPHFAIKRQSFRRLS